MHQFLTNNRDELIARCKAKVAQRPMRSATTEQLANGVPLFLDQLTRTLQAEEDGELAASLRISGAAGGDATALSEIGVSATAHGKQLLALGFTVDQVVHDYGDLCQAITDLAFERDAPFAVDEFRTLNRCLDNAIADAVTAFSVQRDVTVAQHQAQESNQRLGLLVHELRNSLNSASLALAALESGKLPIGGSTGAVLKRSLLAMANLLRTTLDEVRVTSQVSPQREPFPVAGFVTDAQQMASLHATARGCSLDVSVVDPVLQVLGNRELLMAALVNLLHNAFKFTRAGSQVSLSVGSSEGHVHIHVGDHCGGLPPGSAEVMFLPFTQNGTDRSGLGLGLSIARRYVEADGGSLTVRDVPGTGCIFTISLPRHGSAARPGG
ncbi:sensor histidine kinase [Ideonella sp. BN130291]|uniref:sensor histidine kinase n=1 Tax=Ideonella sp. BN130291 TaxID=3112940 RepID=UPI002E2704BA|nr:HAMP domain-containing sensor histidine kinase [Ideonella sp. BN130291]